MLCPSCKSPLSIADRSGIEIDWCPSCRGVWLDRGELDKLIERNAAAMPAGVLNAPDRPPRAPAGRWGEPHHHRPHRKKSFLSEVLDFD